MMGQNGGPAKKPFIPAWKRLGLKLKYAKDSIDDQPNRHDGLGISMAEDDAEPSLDRERSIKKRKTSTDSERNHQSATSKASSRDTGIHNQHGLMDSPPVVVSTEQSPGNLDKSAELKEVQGSTAGNGEVAPSAYEAKPPPRRKSVTFTPETKQGDDFSSPESSKQQATEQQSSNVDSSIASRVPSPPAKSKQEKKRSKRKAEPSKAASSKSGQTKLKGKANKPVTASVPEYVQYLHLFHTNKAAWKFNKKKQKDLLKNLFNLDRIPVEHNEAILEYLAGLEGVGARRRVTESATEVLKEIATKYDSELDPDAMESEEARRAAYYAALQRHLQREERTGGRTEYDKQVLEDHDRDKARGERADAVLREALLKELYPDQAQTGGNETVSQDGDQAGGSDQQAMATTRASQAESKSKRQKRKSRTQMPSEGLSDDESEGEGRASRADVQEKGRDSDSSGAKADDRSEISVFDQFKGKKKIFDDELLDRVFKKKNR